MTYEVNANGNHSFQGNALEVAGVAVAWVKRGLEPKAYSIIDDSDCGIRCIEVPVTTIKNTTKALKEAK